MKYEVWQRLLRPHNKDKDRFQVRGRACGNSSDATSAFLDLSLRKLNGPVSTWPTRSKYIWEIGIAIDVYLQIDGIKGESQDDRHKVTDLASPILMQICAMGKTIPKEKFEFMRADGQEVPIKYFEIE